MIPRRLAPTMMLALLSVVAAAAGPGDSQSADGIIVRRDQQHGTITVIVPTDHGWLDWDDVSRGLARAGRFNEDALAPEIDEHPLNLTSSWARLSLRTLSAATPDVRLRVIEHPSGKGLALKIRLERGDARRKVRYVKTMLRKPFSAGAESYGLRLDENWRQSQANRPLVILVHGYAGDRDSLAGLHKALAKQGFPCGTFAYPNDGPLAVSAKLLADELARFQSQHPARSIAFIAHSMGGLVARAVIENSEYGPFPVKQLIMICPPNHGSPWARLPGGLECFEYWRDDQREPFLEAFSTSISDGLNEARHDLEPGSPFLSRLNARPRNPAVDYAILLGTAAPFTKAEVAAIRGEATHLLAESQTGRFVMPRVETLFDGVRGVAFGNGDGVVSVESGRLKGVEDVLTLPMDHWTVIGDDWTSSIQKQKRLLAEILDRLQPTCKEALSLPSKSTAP